MKRIVIIIPTDLVTNSALSFFIFFYKQKTRIHFSAGWWSGNKIYFCFLLIASRAFLQSYAEFNKLLSRYFLTCYSCSYYSFMVYLRRKYLRASTLCNYVLFVWLLQKFNKFLFFSYCIISQICRLNSLANGFP